MRLLPQPEPHQRPCGVGEVAHPREPVLPVLAAACALGERGRRRRRDGAGRSVDEELEGKGAALHVARPRTAVAELSRPQPPLVDGAVDASLHVSGHREVQRLAVGGRDHQQVAGFLAGREAAGDRRTPVDVVGVGGAVALAVDGERGRTHAQDATIAHVLEPRPRGLQPGAGGHGPRELHRPFHAVDAAGELGPREAAGDAGDHGVGDAGATGRRVERRDEHVGVRDVVAANGVGLDGFEVDAPAGGVVEQAGEHRSGVEVGQRHPVDASVAADEGDRAPVADRCVGAQVDARSRRRADRRGVVHGPHARNRTRPSTEACILARFGVRGAPARGARKVATDARSCKPVRAPRYGA